ncbi:MAG: GTPase Era [Pseudomonadota bacterium]|nr:GTPase Era [Pseudomonadota bacterium]
MDTTQHAFRCGHVAIVGRPNVGKSTLLNHLVGQKVSITSRKAQTTRHRVTGIRTDADAQFIFVDTPGFQTLHRSRLNDRLNRAVTQSLLDVDAVVLVIEAGRTVPADRAVIALLPPRARAAVALNKIDQLDNRDAMLPQMADLASASDFTAIVPISAEKERGIEELVRAVRPLLPEGPALYEHDELTDRDERFMASEFVREKIFRLLGDEVPYATTVGIDSFEQVGNVRRIHATVYVERASQRAILLGEGGARMKEIATRAREDMERLFGGKVFLEVWIKVKSGWADDESSLKHFGY